MSYDPATNIFVTDAALAKNDPRPDLLEREWFAMQVAQRIAQASTGDSVVFGLAGPWGAGKTSTLTQIRNALADVPDDWAVVEFTPWATNNELALTEEFYNTIASALDDNRGRKTENGKKLLNLAAPILAAGAQTLFTGWVESKFGEGIIQKTVDAATEAGADTAKELRFEENPFAERFEKISHFLEELGLRVLVIVDDVDRLHRDELLAVMKAVRLLGRFKGVHYLLSYDTQTVTDVLTHTDLAGGSRRRAEQYLEKIVQYPFQLPPIQDVHLANVIDKRLRELAERGGYDTDRSEQDLEVLLARLPLDHLTLRTVYRLFAQVDMILALITEKGSTARPCDEINLLDAILLTYLRLEHHELYRHLVTWKSDLTYQTGKSVDVDKDHKRATMLREKISITIDPEGKNPTDTQRALTVLRALFPEAVPRVDGSYRTIPEAAPLQIRQPTYFDRYFAFGFPAKDIRDRSIRAELITLINTGDLPRDSVIRAHAHDRVKGPLLRTKIRDSIGPAMEQVSDLSHCGDAARTLTRLTTDQERREPVLHAWWAAVTYQLWTKLEPRTASAAVSAYLDEFGADMAAISANIGSPSPEMPLAIATQTVWDRIHDEVVDAFFDISTELPERNALTQHQYWIENRPLLHMKVSDSIEQRAANQGGLDLIGAATRLVTVQSSFNGSKRRRYLAGPNIHYLTSLVPRENWPSNQIPDTLIPDVDRSDFSYDSRRNFAANAIFESTSD
ncbi:hypothetical protein FK531_10720 [Rhodococcus spelaei]|uniref:KAP NTPase domain-containing protein n=1 Tax=Rhodococcus spelaei TaxID=2546320 RepID=A0A541BA53_9NOCA|nr:P-loop NTPase fold protein [Rhodococcus spelaei]TQF69215.1 hypothetical protein FK531_10720 [Rhodococcus spelaei]